MIQQLVARAAEKKASDLHLICGLSPRFRVAGRLVSEEGEVPLSDADCTFLAKELLGERFSELCEKREADVAADVAGVRVRGSLFYQQGHISIALRLLAEAIPPLSSLGLPPAAEGLTERSRGIILVTGETGSGKSTTLASLIDHINHTRACHVITLEDPIEYRYTPDLCIFNQREVGFDTTGFAAGLRAALREDPDVILVGEMRDRETIETALTAAETGHLVFGTLHTGSAADCVDRIVGAFSSEDQQQVRMQLSMTLQAVFAQQLLPNETGARVLACELMIVNAAVRNLIREGKTPQITSAIATAGEIGSITMDAALLRLYRAGRISAKTALTAAADPGYLKKQLGSHF